MNTYAVFHRKTIFEIDIFETDLFKLHWPEEYRLVSSVEAENLEQVFAKTQHIDHEWWQNPGVELLDKSQSVVYYDYFANAIFGLAAAVAERVIIGSSSVTRHDSCVSVRHRLRR